MEAENKIKTELIHLKELNIKHCNGCDEYCKKFGTCQLNDDMIALYSKMKSADILVVATPVYFWNVSGYIKDLFDRSLPLYYHGLLKGKLGAAIAVSRFDGQDRTLSSISHFFQLHDMKQIGSIGISLQKKDTIGVEELELAKTLGKQIASHLPPSFNA